MNLPNEVRVLQPKWLGMLNEVVLVQLHIGRWRAKTSLSMGDLGLPDSGNEWERMIRLGEKILLPPIPPMSKYFDKRKQGRTYAAALDSVEQSARYFADHSTLKVLWGRILNLRRYDWFRGELARYEEAYFALRDELVQDESVWESHVDALTNAYRKFAAESADRLFKLQGSPLAFKADEFEKALLTRVESLIPTWREYRDSFYFKAEYSFIDVSAWTDASARNFALEQLIKDPRNAAARAAYEETLAAQKKIIAEKQAEVDRVRDEFVSAIVSQTRAAVYSTAVSILEAMQRNDWELRGRSVTSLKTLWDILDRCSVQDQDAQGMKEAVRSLIALGSDRGDGDVAKVLRAIAIVARQTLLSLDEKPRQARELGIPDVPDTQSVTRARVLLDLPTLEPVEVERRRRVQ